MRFSLLNVPFTLFTFLILLTRCTSYTPIPNANDELQIRNKLALYAYAIDFKIYDDLEKVFTQDAYAIYGPMVNDQLNGVCMFLFTHWWAVGLVCI